jgi:16S rRNA U516 pseudouridylate synthase RsuA-like enzyme
MEIRLNKLISEAGVCSRREAALSKSAVAQRIAANPKSAALRKTSKNNPINKAKRAAHRKNRNHEGDE